MVAVPGADALFTLYAIRLAPVYRLCCAFGDTAVAFRGHSLSKSQRGRACSAATERCRTGPCRNRSQVLPPSPDESGPVCISLDRLGRTRAHCARLSEPSLAFISFAPVLAHRVRVGKDGRALSPALSHYLVAGAAALRIAVWSGRSRLVRGKLLADGLHLLRRRSMDRRSRAGVAGHFRLGALAHCGQRISVWHLLCGCSFRRDDQRHSEHHPWTSSEYR